MKDPQEGQAVHVRQVSWSIDAVAAPLQEQGATNIRVKCEAPLSEMFGYIGDLRSNTSGRGQFTMEFSHYAPCPRNIVEEVKEAVREREEAKK